MRIARAVIGAAFGDEGKGLLVDRFSAANSTVVRYNGGAQAGHTVVMADGRRHVFHHFSSGSFRGAMTYLSRFFISNPIVYLEELTALRKLGVQPRVTADPRGYVTTPYDMMINQIIEQQRGGARHGSVGLGINETIKRCERDEFRLTVWDLHDPVTLIKTLDRIRDEWVPQRLRVLDVVPTTEYQEHLASTAIINHYIADAQSFYRSIGVLSKFLDLHADIVFEGAQGLLLDQDHQFFPYVTHSHTGLNNIIALAKAANVDAVDVTYVTRAYATRHGAGPFPREVIGLHYDDNTNVVNDWQGALRFGHLDLDLLGDTIQADMMRDTSLPIRVGLAITHLDQVGPEVPVWFGGQLHHIAPLRLPQQVLEWLDIHVDYVSDGPTAEDVWFL